MKVTSISGITCYIKDLDVTAAFYESLGFRFGKRDERQMTAYVNWFWITFIAQDSEDKPAFLKEAHLGDRGSGLYLHLKVEDVDAVYAEVVELGMKPSSEPRDWPTGSREFVLRDPDGYKIVFFSKKGN
jgi:catechol 2,3-dioxygenase-like lactoylglutathione lyase family enzyme